MNLTPTPLEPQATPPAAPLPPSTLHLPPSPRPLLPDSVKQPFMLLWLWVIPQLGLLLLNLRAWSLAAGEAMVEQAHAAAGLGAAEVALLAVGVASWLVPRLRGRAIGLPACGAGLLLSIAYLWFFFTQFDHVWPAAVADWMLPQTEIVFYQFALVMPALFYCGLRLACVELRLNRGVDIGLSFGMFVAIPLGWYVLFHIIEVLVHRFFQGAMEVVAIVFFASSTVLVMMAFLRLLYFLYTWLSAQSWGQTAMTAIAGLLCPIGGLLLNIEIPFPCDFQSVGIYALAVLNGLVLIAPLPRQPNLALLVWWARSALYTFSLYFFIVFLPFLPLSLLAMLACGAGFLILAPTLLFIIHTRRLAADAATLGAARGRGPVLALFLAGLITIPAGFTALAWLDRQALSAAMDTVFSPDIRQTRVSLHPLTVAHSLNRLRDMKDGIYLPFVSDAYDRLVFNGMVLPDDKMETLSRVLLGRPARRADKPTRFSLFLAPRALTHWGSATRALLPRNVAIQPPALPETVVTNGVRRSTVKLELTNNGPANSEFVGTLKAPDGVLVSGFWLDVGGKRKAGTIAEKKTALWIYHMIRDYTRRDPGLLVYEADGALRLSVFPFATNETRTVWLEFTTPAAWAASVTLNGTSVPLTPEPSTPGGTPGPSLVPAAEACVIPAAALRQLPAAARTPVVRFILDRSAAAVQTVTIPPALCRAVAPLGGRCRASFANVESVDIDLQPEGPNEAAELAQRPVDLPARAGFAPDRVMARVLLDAAIGGATVPVFVVIPAPGSTPVRTLDLRPFARLAPDVPAYYVWSSNHLDRVSFADGSVRQVETPESPAPVVLFRSGDRVTAVLPGSPGAIVEAPLTPNDSTNTTPRVAPPDVYNPESGAFEALSVSTSLDDAAYAAGVRLQLDCEAMRLEPATLDRNLPTVVERSRATGILCPFTAFMVLENTAQEKTLAARQKQALGAHHALEFEEHQETVKSPEPGALWLLPVILPLVWWMRRSRARA